MLLSYAFHAKADLHAIRRDLVCGRLLIDSGAFTADTTGKPIRLEEYAEFLTTFRDAWDHAITLDVIGDAKATARQTRKLHGMGLPVMPVFTRGESVKEFDAMVRDAGYVCVGGGVGLPTAVVEKRAALLQRRAEDLGGGIHALGIGAIPSLRRVRPYSADASNISGVFRFGRVAYYDGRNVKRPLVRDRAALKAAESDLRAHDINLAYFFKHGRIPPAGPDLANMMRGMTYSYAVADEHLKQGRRAPVPHGVNDIPGVHLYSSVATNGLAPVTARTDREIHDPEGRPPRVWGRYARHHQHHPGHRAARLEESTS